jgi:hypothetical protein
MDKRALHRVPLLPCGGCVHLFCYRSHRRHRHRRLSVPPRPSGPSPVAKIEVHGNLNLYLRPPPPTRSIGSINDTSHPHSLFYPTRPAAHGLRRGSLRLSRWPRLFPLCLAPWATTPSVCPPWCARVVNASAVRASSMTDFSDYYYYYAPASAPCLE